MAGELKVGDRVQLKSGGPIMTVEELDNYGADTLQASCTWFDNKNEVKRAVFKVEMLESG